VAFSPQAKYTDWATAIGRSFETYIILCLDEFYAFYIANLSQVYSNISG
jgi:hypothetical protein